MQLLHWLITLFSKKRSKKLSLGVGCGLYEKLKRLNFENDKGPRQNVPNSVKTNVVEQFCIWSTFRGCDGPLKLPNLANFRIFSSILANFPRPY